MSRRLLCAACNKELSALAERYSEFYESVEGNSNWGYLCDDCGKNIHKGDICFASCLLDSKNHPNYVFQKPEAWMNEYFITKKME